MKYEFISMVLAGNTRFNQQSIFHDKGVVLFVVPVHINHIINQMKGKIFICLGLLLIAMTIVHWEISQKTNRRFLSITAKKFTFRYTLWL